jgi:hypothetical protein
LRRHCDCGASIPSRDASNAGIWALRGVVVSGDRLRGGGVGLLCRLFSRQQSSVIGDSAAVGVISVWHRAEKSNNGSADSSGAGIRQTAAPTWWCRYAVKESTGDAGRAATLFGERYLL